MVTQICQLIVKKEVTEGKAMGWWCLEQLAGDPPISRLACRGQHLSSDDSTTYLGVTAENSFNWSMINKVVLFKN